MLQQEANEQCEKTFSSVQMSVHREMLSSLNSYVLSKRNNCTYVRHADASRHKEMATKETVLPESVSGISVRNSPFSRICLREAVHHK